MLKSHRLANGNAGLECQTDLRHDFYLTVKFRAVCLKPDLKPFIGVVKYDVKDPNGNIVLLNTNVELTHGVAGGQISLSKDALPGMWKISFAALVRIQLFVLILFHIMKIYYL